MKKITATELKSILASHKLWIESSCKQGECADLSDADLSDANLKVADLRGANLKGANLKGADLTDADLTGTNLEKKAEKKAEKQTEVASVKSEISIRSEIEAIAKKHGMKVDSIALSFL